MIIKTELNTYHLDIDRASRQYIRMYYRTWLNLYPNFKNESEDIKKEIRHSNKESAVKQLVNKMRNNEVNIHIRGVWWSK